MKTALILLVAILICAKNETWIAAATFIFVTFIEASIYMYTIDFDLALSRRREVLETIARSFLYRGKSDKALPCGHPLTHTQLMLLFHPLSEHNACPQCARPVFTPPDMEEAKLFRLAVAGTLLAALRDTVGLALHCWHGITSGEGIHIKASHLFIGLLVIWELRVLVEAGKAMCTRGPQWWHFWDEKVMGCVVGMPLALYWAVWLPFEFQGRFANRGNTIAA